MEDSTPNEILTLPVGIVTSQFVNLLSTLNPKISVVKQSPTQISLSTARSIDFSGVWDIKNNFELLEELNPNLRIELFAGNLFISSPMGSLAGAINSAITRQLENWNYPANAVEAFGRVGDSSTEFYLPWGRDYYMRPDASWMQLAQYLAVAPAIRNIRFPGVPHYVNETVSFHDSIYEQRRKCGFWVWSNVEVVSLVDYYRGHTYLYASTNSQLLPAPGAAVGVIVHPDYPEVTEQDFLWPALPALTAAGDQHGPPLVVALPAACTMVLTGGPFAINHGRFLL